MNEEALYQILAQLLQAPAGAANRTTMEPQFRLGPNGQPVEVPRKIPSEKLKFDRHGKLTYDAARLEADRKANEDIKRRLGITGQNIDPGFSITPEMLFGKR